MNSQPNYIINMLPCMYKSPWSLQPPYVCLIIIATHQHTVVASMQRVQDWNAHFIILSACLIPVSAGMWKYRSV